MADFSQTQLTPIQDPGTVQPGVTKASSLSGVGTVVGDVLGGVGSIFEGIKAGKQAAAVTNFAQNQLSIASAVESGAISSKEGRTRMRAAFSSALADNPALLKELSDTHKSIITTAGLGQVVDKGTEEEQKFQAAVKAATEDGFITSLNPSQEEIELGLAQHEQFTIAKRDLDLLKKQIDTESAAIGLDKAKIELNASRQKEAAKVALGKLVSSYGPVYYGNIKNIMQQYSGTEKSAEQRVQAKQALQNEWLQIQANLDQFKAQAGSEYANNLSSTMKQAYENALEYVDGKVTLEALNTSLDIKQGVSAMNLMGDPDIAMASGLSKVIGSVALANLPGLNAAVSNKLLNNGKLRSGKVADPLVDRKEDQQASEDFDSYLGFVKGAIGSVNSGVMQPGVNAGDLTLEINNNIVSMLEGINAYKDSVQRPEEYNKVIQFFSSPAFGQFASKQGGIPKDIANTAAQVVEQRYEQVVAPLIKENFLTNNVTVNEKGVPTPGSSITPPRRPVSMPATEVLEPVFDGAGVSFRVKEGFDVNDADVRALNRTLTPVNNLIRFYSHLEGSTNYQKAWDRLGPLLFGTEEPQQQEVDEPGK